MSEHSPPRTLTPLSLTTQGEYDYSTSVEVFADGTVETFRGSYVTRGTERRALTEYERQALARAVAALDWHEGLPDAGGSLTHRLVLDPRSASSASPLLLWRDALPDDRPAVQTLVALLRSL